MRGTEALKVSGVPGGPSSSHPGMLTRWSSHGDRSHLCFSLGEGRGSAFPLCWALWGDLAWGTRLSAVLPCPVGVSSLRGTFVLGWKAAEVPLLEGPPWLQPHHAYGMGIFLPELEVSCLVNASAWQNLTLLGS